MLTNLNWTRHEIRTWSQLSFSSHPFLSTPSHPHPRPHTHFPPASGHHQSALCFHEWGFLLDSTYQWDHTVFVFLSNLTSFFLTGYFVSPLTLVHHLCDKWHHHLNGVSSQLTDGLIVQHHHVFSFRYTQPNLRSKTEKHKCPLKPKVSTSNPITQETPRNWDPKWPSNSRGKTHVRKPMVGRSVFHQIQPNQPRLGTPFLCCLHKPTHLPVSMCPCVVTITVCPSNA